MVSCLSTDKPLVSQGVPPKEELFSAKHFFIIALVVAAIAAPFFPHSLPLFAVSAWYLWSAIIVAANDRADNSPLKGIICRLHAVAIEVHATIASALLFPLTLFPSYHNPQGTREGRPILLVNGYLSFGSTWHYQRQKLVEAGFGPIYTMNVGSGLSIEHYAQQVKEKIEAIGQETKKNEITLIGHSKGGLVSSYCAANLLKNSAMTVTNIVTIGSPLQGTSVANFGLGKDAQEMLPGSDFLQNLQDSLDKDSHIRFFHIAAAQDLIVPVDSALRKKNPPQTLLIKDLGHKGLIFSSRVATQIAHWLREDPRLKKEPSSTTDIQ